MESNKVMNFVHDPLCYSKSYRHKLKEIYKTIIDFRKANPCKDTYFEIHHIVPRHLCKKLGIEMNAIENKVQLSVKEHAFVHMILDRTRGFKVIGSKSLKRIAENKINGYKQSGLQKAGKSILTPEDKHAINLSRKAILSKYKKKINDFVITKASAIEFNKAICTVLRKQLAIPEEIEFNVPKKLTGGLRNSIPTMLTLGLPKELCGLN